MGPTSTRETLSTLLGELDAGDDDAFRHAFGALYDQLRLVAHDQRKRWHGDPTLSTTVLVHEAYLKLADGRHPAFDGRGHFLRVASRAMRHVLCNYARDRRRLKRGGGMRRATAGPDEVAGVDPDDLETVIALDRALERLAAADERLARVVECRFFGGLSVADTAEALGVSAATVKRDWTLARAWLSEALGGPPAS